MCRTVGPSVAPRAAKAGGGLWRALALLPERLLPLRPSGSVSVGGTLTPAGLGVEHPDMSADCRGFSSPHWPREPGHPGPPGGRAHLANLGPGHRADRVIRPSATVRFGTVDRFSP